jgi:type VI secretion system protein ImpA
MPSPEVLDFAKLLAPIDEAQPVGVDLRTDPSPVSDYHSIRSARQSASETERRNDQGDDLGPPDWRAVLDRSVKVLGAKAKDLEVTAYLIESLVRVHGFAGLRDGFHLARGLVEQFGDALYPLADGDPDVESRFSHILWLSGIDKPGTLIAPVRKIPFTADSGNGPLNLTHHHQAMSLNAIGDAKVRQKKIDEGAISLEKIQEAIAATPPSFYADLVADIGKCREEFTGFCDALREKTGYDAPNSDLLGVLESYLDVVKDLARNRIPSQAPADEAAAAQAAAPAAGAEAAAQVAAVVDPGIIRDRRDALDRLAKVAEYFRKNEPQSLIPYALEQVINWGSMSLPDLLSELIPEEAPRKNLFKQVGIRLPEAKK